MQSTNSGKYELVDATLGGNLCKVVELIDEGVDVDITNSPDLKTPLHLAAAKGLCTIANHLIAAGANINTSDLPNGESPLHSAAKEGYRDVCVSLVAAGANVNATCNKNSFTPLHESAWGGHTAVFNLLVEAGADVDAKDSGQLSPLDMAAFHGHVSISTALIAAGVEVRKSNAKYGHWTPLHLAARSGRGQICSALVAAGASVHARDSREMTPLICAGWYGQAEACEVLLHAGAAVDAKDLDGHTALHFAVKYKSEPDAILVLLGAGADMANLAEFFCGPNPCPFYIWAAAAARGVVSCSYEPARPASDIRNQLDMFPTTAIDGMGLERACSGATGITSNRAMLASMRSSIASAGVEW